MKKLTPQEADKLGYWVCACVKRDRQGNLAAVKMNHPSIKRCRKCGAVPPPKEKKCTATPKAPEKTPQL